MRRSPLSRRADRQQRGNARVMDPSTLPRPKLYAEPSYGEQPQAFAGRAEDDAPPETQSKTGAYVAVGLMIVGLILVGVFVATTSWPLLVLGLVVGAVGAALAWKVHIMRDVSVYDK